MPLFQLWDGGVVPASRSDLLESDRESVPDRGGAYDVPTGPDSGWNWTRHSSGSIESTAEHHRYHEAISDIESEVSPTAALSSADALGSFIIGRDTQPSILAEQYTASGLDPQPAAAQEYVQARDGSGERLDMAGGPFFESLVPSMTFRSGRLASISRHSIELLIAAPAGSRGTPRLAEGELAVTILERFARFCEPFGLEFSVDDGIGRWQTVTQ